MIKFKKIEKHDTIYEINLSQKKSEHGEKLSQIISLTFFLSMVHKFMKIIFDEFYVMELSVFSLLPLPTSHSQLVTLAIFCWQKHTAKIKMSHYAKLHSSIYIEEMIRDKWHNFRSSSWKIFLVDLGRYFYV